MRSEPRCARWLPLLACAVLVALGASAIGAEQRPQPRVLVLQSYHPTMAWADAVQRGIDAGLGAMSPEPTELLVEFLDTKRHPDPGHRARLLAMLRGKYADEPIDCCLSVDDNAFELALLLRRELLRDVPLVFCGVNHYDPERFAQIPALTGVIEAWDVGGTLTLMQRLHPELSEVVIVNDDTTTGRANRRTIAPVVAEHDGQLSVRWIGHRSDDSLEHVCQELAALGPRSAVLLMSFNRDAAGRYLGYREAARVLSAASARPLYGVWGFYLGHGIVGGVLTDGEDQGQVASRLTRRVLAGEDAAAVPVIALSPTRHAFDHRQLTRFGIDPALLPPGSRIIEVPVPTMWERLWRWLVFGLALAVVQFAIIVGLLRARQTRRQAEARVREANAELSRSLEFNRTLLAAIPTPVFFKDNSGRYLGCNPAFTAVMGVTSSELVGKTVHELWPGQEAGVYEQHDRALLRDAGHQRYESTVTDRSGRSHEVVFTKDVFRDASGAVAGVVGAFLDISERKRMERAVAGSERRLNAILDSLGDAVIATDADGRIERMNPIAERLTGWSESEARGMTLEAVLHLEEGDPPQRRQELIGRIIAGEQEATAKLDTVLISRTGRETPVADTAAPIRDQAGTVTGVVMVCRDVSEERSLAERLRRSERLDAIGLLAGGIAHDFNNMLGGILGAADLLEHTLDAQSPGHAHAQMIAEAARRAGELTRKLLAYSRKGPTRSSVVDLNAAVGDAVAILERSIDRRIAIATDLNAGAVTVRGDRAQLQSVFLNLGLNASDAMPDGGALVFATHQRTWAGSTCGFCGQHLPPGAYVEVSVRDEGQGMAPEVLVHACEPFFTTKQPGKGTGLGLSAVQGIVCEHGGELRIDSAPGVGTTIRILLPQHSENATVQEERPPTGGLDLHGRHALLIDDEPVVRRMTRAMLEHQGCRCSEAENGAVAVQLFAAEHDQIDLVLLDLVMPVKDGAATLPELLAIDPAARILLVSGYPRGENVEALLAAGAGGFLQKPFDRRALRAELASLLRRGHA
ncbi:MAG: PAS domain S-box protein [Planctomycetota bacterium]